MIEQLVSHHDWRWIAPAVLICVLGLGTTFHLIATAGTQTGQRRRTTGILGAFIGGLAIFATHFASLQGEHWASSIRYDIPLTLASFIGGTGAIIAATMIVLGGQGWPRRLGAASLAYVGVVIIHFTGLAAVDLPGSLKFALVPTLVYVAAGFGLAIATECLFRGPGLKSHAATTVACVTIVLGLHFLAESAVTYVPSPASALAPVGVSAGVMTGIVVAIVAIILVVAGIASTTLWAARSSALSHIREAIEAMPDGLAFFDAEDRLVLWNSRYAEINPELKTTLQAGQTFRQILQIGLDEGLYTDAKGREDDWIAERLAARRQLSTTMEQKIAGDRWLRVADRQSSAGGSVTVTTDITDLKRAAENLAEARDAAEAANGAKSQFLANMSHEIRTPLNGVIGIAQALAATELTTNQREMLDLIHSSGRTLQALLSDILDLARVESGRLSLSDDAFDLAAAVREAAQLYAATARDKGLQFYVEVSPDVELWISGDVVRLKQVLTNLVSNAVKFTATGFVNLTVARGPDSGDGETLRFTVEDTGIGFDCETRERLFKRFEQADGAITRRFGGTGLGLAISHQLASLMDGNLDCESEPGGGSAFILTIPLRLAASPAAPLEDVSVITADPNAPALRVLVADDHATNRKVVELILAQAAVELTMVEDGAEALEAYRAGEFDLVLMDMQMPVMDGLAATREIRLHEATMGLPRTPVVMLTANALAEHVTAAEDAGADLHLAKPFNAAQLLSVVFELPAAAAAEAAAANAAIA
ncbi:ATP-binding protein [uncultured Brevundimonas sp.]|uniref:ATP-binding protein n=1 Tax=uncultured Brevundimonas sp. TaxID=213418 RepID=UPI0030EC5DA4|tara:strand:+ start:34405 stop:36702 length:2298 start_codon:yes stop_codon:yes gene_type:complete